MVFSRVPLTLLALFGMALPAAAQSAPHYDRSQLAVGAAYSWEASDGLSKGVNLGFDGQDYRFSITRLGPDGRETESIYGTSQEGRLLWDSLEGDKYSYLPHDCSFVSGTCAGRIENNGTSIGSFTNTSYFEDGIWTHIEKATYTGQAPITTYICGIYDQDSITQALYVVDNINPPFWLRITSGPNAAHSREMLARVTDACQKARPNA
jgi:hypothetical protein